MVCGIHKSGGVLLPFANAVTFGKRGNFSFADGRFAGRGGGGSDYFCGLTKDDTLYKTVRSCYLSHGQGVAPSPA
jgi:prepilin-type processing-associated H-X9-DG protein